MAVICLFCNKTYSHQSGLNDHIKKTHQIEKNVISYAFHVYKARCLDCQCSFRFISDLRHHLETKHDCKSEMEKLEFHNKDGTYTKRPYFPIKFSKYIYSSSFP